MKEYRFAIIGCGNIAPRHAEQIRKHGILQAVCDTERDKADRFGNLYQAHAYYSIDELLEEEGGVDVVVVCTPNGLHAEHSIKSLQAGRHVICEKPMCLSSAAGWSMRDTAHFFRRYLFVIKQNRFNPPVRAVKDLIEKGQLGKILSVQVNGFWNRGPEYYRHSWKGTQDLDGGILYTQFSHFIDLLYWFFGGVTETRSFRENLLLGKETEIEDNLVAIARLANGALCSMHFSVNAFEQNMEGSVTILGEKGTVKIGGQYLNTLEYQRISGVEPIDIGEKMVAANDYGHYQGSMSNHDKAYERILSVLRGSGEKYVSAEDGLKTVEIIEKLYTSLQ